jgi:hypothetical protein
LTGASRQSITRDSNRQPFGRAICRVFLRASRQNHAPFKSGAREIARALFAARSRPTSQSSGAARRPPVDLSTFYTVQDARRFAAQIEDGIEAGRFGAPTVRATRREGTFAWKACIKAPSDFSLPGEQACFRTTTMAPS